MNFSKEGLKYKDVWPVEYLNYKYQTIYYEMFPTNFDTYIQYISKALSYNFLKEILWKTSFICNEGKSHITNLFISAKFMLLITCKTIIPELYTPMKCEML